MGRGHTIFARVRGFVRYYQDPEFRVRGKGRGEAGMGRKYIGVVHTPGEHLPRGRGAARRRVLGMEYSTAAGAGGVGQGRGGEVAGEAEEMGMEVVSAAPVEKKPMVEVAEAAKAAKAAVLRRPVLRPGHTYVESNWSIGRAAERAGVKVRSYNPNDRFLAWRKANARKARDAERRGLTRKKGKK